MKLVSFKVGGKPSYGVVKDGGVIDAGRRLGAAFPDLKSVLGGGLDKLRAIAGEAPDHALDAVELLPVVPNPDKIFCIGVNYMTHLKETGRPTPTHPMIFSRFPDSLVGHGRPMLRPPESIMYDFEGELAVVMGSGGRRIPKARALDHVAGYACINEGTLRDWQRQTAQFLPGKTFESSGSFGPWLVTADEIPDPAAQTLTTRLNGEVMQQAEVSDLIFDIPTLIEHISTFTTLRPGDVISTGTTGGVGAYREPPVWMKHGDTVEVEISGIGILKNPVVDEKV